MSIRIASSAKDLSSLGGLVLCDRVLGYLNLAQTVPALLPPQDFVRRSSPFEKFQTMLLSFVAGAHCLDDIARLGRDSAFVAAVGTDVNAPSTFGDFLRGFSDVQCRGLNDVLIDTALLLRRASGMKPKAFIVDIDSTPHEQCGVKMEGVETNYKGLWCLDSIEAFDQFGFQLWFDLRPGSTYTSNGAPEIISSIFRRAPKNEKRFLRADSGYCNVDVFNAARTANAKFVITMKSNMYTPLLAPVDNWTRSSRISFYDGRECEIGHTLYFPKQGHEALRVVIIRARKGDETGKIFEQDKYDHYAWVTNIGQHEMTDEKIIKFYRGRGHAAENMIRELKNGFDLKHFPCQKLMANKAYGLIAAFAYNLTRFLAFVENPTKAHFSKLVRWKMISLPVQVVRHAREVTFRFTQHHFEEVTLWIQRIHIKFMAITT